MEYGAVLFCKVLEHGDGILVLTLPGSHPPRTVPLRVYLTDSGHYLLPTDQFDTPEDPRLRKKLRERLNLLVRSLGLDAEDAVVLRAAPEEHPITGSGLDALRAPRS
eukprot:3883838-Lingulodinium_polyedra.AAC.1